MTEATKTREDIHRVSKIEPADYEYLFSFSYAGGGLFDLPVNVALLTAVRTGEPQREPVIGVSSSGFPVITGYNIITSPWGKLPFFHKAPATGGCDICGSHFRHGDVWRHKPSGECIVIGHICAGKYSLFAERGAWAEIRAQMDIKKARAEKKAKRRAALKEFAKENRDVLPLLKTDHPIARNMREKLLISPWYWLSDNQVNLLKKLNAQAEEKKNEKKISVPDTDERIEIVGTVISVKDKESNFYPYPIIWKMTVKVETDEGYYLIWGTVPESLFSQAPNQILKGCKVAFTAAVTVSNRDDSFGFFKRPTKARVINGPQENNRETRS